MRKSKVRIRSTQEEVSPWIHPEVIESQRLGEEPFLSFAISHSNESIHETSHSLGTPQLSRTNSPMKESKQRVDSAQVHGKTLSVIKDYCRKYYTEQSNNAQDVPLPLKDRRSMFQRLRASPQSLKKTSVVDLTRTLEDYLIQPLTKKSRNKNYQGSKILKIKQEMIRSKQRQKIDKRLQSPLCDLRPISTTMPVRQLVRPATATSFKKNRFPDQNFGVLLQNFLQKL